jgi:hypothetical protein
MNPTAKINSVKPIRVVLFIAIIPSPKRMVAFYLATIFKRSLTGLCKGLVSGILAGMSGIPYLRE